MGRASPLLLLQALEQGLGETSARSMTYLGQEPENLGSAVIFA